MVSPIHNAIWEMFNSEYRIIFLVTALIYVTIGAEIYKKRQQLRSMAAQHDAMVYNIRRSEIHILSEISTCNVVGSRDLPAHEVHVSSAIPESQEYPQNTVSVNSTHSGSLDPVESAKPKEFLSGSDAAAWAYTKCAMLFFAALIITWVSHQPCFEYGDSTLTSAGSVYMQSSIHSGRVRGGKLHFVLHRGVGITSAGFLECHDLHHHIPWCLSRIVAIDSSPCTSPRDCTIQGGEQESFK